jgi:hypothetical protein
MSDTWSWADHACRTCFGRLVKRTAPGGAPVFECGNCEVTAKGTPDGICGCGVLPPPSRFNASAAAAPRFRCLPNPERTLTDSAAVVIRWGSAPGPVGAEARTA